MNHRQTLTHGLWSLLRPLYDRGLYPDISARSSPFEPGDHPYLAVAVPVSVDLPWCERPTQLKMLRTVKPAVYYADPLAIRWHVDALSFWCSPYRPPGAASVKLLQRHEAVMLAPIQNCEISFLPGQTEEVAKWLADLLVTGQPVPTYFWWPEAFETLSRTRGTAR